MISSRGDEYAAIAKPLRLYGAIRVRPLTTTQVSMYLRNLGGAGQSVRAAFQEDPALSELLDSPLMLNVITVAYAASTAQDVSIHGTEVERRDRIFASYVNKMLQRRPAQTYYAPERTIRWLSWLAYQMANHGQTAFYLEQLQSDWFPVPLRRAIRVCTGLSAGLLFGLVAGFFAALIAGPYVGLIAGLLLGLYVWVHATVNERTSSVEIVRWSRMGFEPRILFAALSVGLVADVLVGLVAGLFFGTVDGLVFGLVFVLGFGFFAGWLSGLTFDKIDTRAAPNEGISRCARNALSSALVIGLVSGLAAWTLQRLGLWAICPDAIRTASRHCDGCVCCRDRLATRRAGDRPTRWHVRRRRSLPEAHGASSLAHSHWIKSLELCRFPEICR